jgi:hypothetical protein
MEWAWSRGVVGREMLMGSVVGGVAPSELRESLGRASGLEKEDVRFAVNDVTLEFCPVGSYPRGG